MHIYNINICALSQLIKGNLSLNKASVSSKHHTLYVCIYVCMAVTN